MANPVVVHLSDELKEGMRKRALEMGLSPARCYAPLARLAIKLFLDPDTGIEEAEGIFTWKVERYSALLSAVFGRKGLQCSESGCKIIDEVLGRALGKTLEEVLRLRFGLDTGMPLGLEETSLLFGKAPVTRERIRQMETNALRQLRHPAWTRRLKPAVVAEVDGMIAIPENAGRLAEPPACR